MTHPPLSQEVARRALEALTALRDACKAHPAMQGREYVDLGIQVNSALSSLSAALADKEAGEPDDEKVICPACSHQFRAIPVQVQQLMLSAGLEPPFTSPPGAPAPGWQPMDSAPRDMEVLLWGVSAGEISGPAETAGIDLGRYCGPGGDYPGFDWCSSLGDAYAVWVKPTHWMPLPVPPASPTAPKEMPNG